MGMGWVLVVVMGMGTNGLIGVGGCVGGREERFSLFSSLAQTLGRQPQASV